MQAQIAKGLGRGNVSLIWALGWERVTGIEPALSAWEADVLPLNYTRRPARRYPRAPNSGAGGSGTGMADGAAPADVLSTCCERRD